MYIGNKINQGITGILKQKANITPRYKTTSTPSAPQTSATTFEVGGVSKPGYIKNGVTYQDKNYTQRVPVGAIVNTAGGTYRMTPNGGVPTEQTQINQYNTRANRYIDEYRLSRDAYNAKVDADVAAALGRIESQRAGVNRDRDSANRASYGAYLQATNPYGAGAEQLAAVGLDNSGYSETSKLAAGTAYQQGISQNELARMAAMNELDRQANEAVLAAQGQKAEAYAEYARYLASMGLQNEQYASDLAANAEQRAYGKERDQRGDTIQDDEIAYNRGQDKINNMWTALGNGYYPTDAAATLNLLQEDLDWNKRLSRSKGEAELAQYAYSTLQAKNALAAAQRNSQLAASGGSYGGSSGKKKSGGGGNGNDGGGYNPEASSEGTLKKAKEMAQIAQAFGNTAGRKAAVADMLQRWYNVNSSERFDQIVAEAIASGKLTEDEDNAWLDSKGL